MAVHEVGERRGINLRPLDGHLAQVNALFSRRSPFPRVFVAKEGFTGIRLLASELNAPFSRCWVTVVISVYASRAQKGFNGDGIERIPTHTSGGCLVPCG